MGAVRRAGRRRSGRYRYRICLRQFVGERHPLRLLLAAFEDRCQDKIPTLVEKIEDGRHGHKILRRKLSLGDPVLQTGGEPDALGKRIGIQRGLPHERGPTPLLATDRGLLLVRLMPFPVGEIVSLLQLAGSPRSPALRKR